MYPTSPLVYGLYACEKVDNYRWPRKTLNLKENLKKKKEAESPT